MRVVPDFQRGPCTAPRRLVVACRRRLSAGLDHVRELTHHSLHDVESCHKAQSSCHCEETTCNTNEGPLGGGAYNGLTCYKPSNGKNLSYLCTVLVVDTVTAAVGVDWRCRVDYSAVRYTHYRYTRSGGSRKVEEEMRGAI